MNSRDTTIASTDLPDISLRPIESGDRDFLYSVYASTRVAELGSVNWTTEQKNHFLWSQFSAQHQHYQQHYADANFDIVLHKNVPIGRLYVLRQPHDIRVVDIALLPDKRNSGIGSKLLRQLMSEAASAGCPLSIHVECFNPARRLYDRLGFKEVKDLGVYVFMQWSA